jgi:archaemetzincin
MSQLSSRLDQRLRELGDHLPQARVERTQQPKNWARQTIDDYRNREPVRINGIPNMIYILLWGELSDWQLRGVELCGTYLVSFTGAHQIHYVSPRCPQLFESQQSRLSDQVLGEVSSIYEYMSRSCPNNALSYQAITSAEFWNLGTQLWSFGLHFDNTLLSMVSLARNGQPELGRTEFLQFVRRTISTASHELCHVFGMEHCIEYQCLMNDTRDKDERDERPMYPCPACIQKLWHGLQLEPLGHVQRLGQFCEINELRREAEWFGQVMRILGDTNAQGS